MWSSFELPQKGKQLPYLPLSNPYNMSKSIIKLSLGLQSFAIAVTP